MSLRILGDPRPELGGVRRHELEGDRRRFDAGRVDRRAGGTVALGIGGADRHRQVAHNRLRPMSRDPGQVMRRSIGIVFADGGLLTLSGTGSAHGDGHGEEPLLAVLCDPDAAPLTFEEALLSTEYGEDGVAAAGDPRAVARHRGRPAAARRRHADQLGRRRGRRPRDSDRLLPLGGRGPRGSRPLRDRPGAWLSRAVRSRRSSPTSAAVLTTPLMGSFLALQDEVGVSVEDFGEAMRAAGRGGRRRDPPLQARARRHHRTGIPRDAARPARGATRPPSQAAPLPRDLFRGARPERADDRPDAGPEALRSTDGDADQQRPGVGAAVADDACRSTRSSSW